ncbi:putative GPI-anchored protein [Trifolium repens]|nr:putative GPI-anchored protein [Trifolium repens]
MQSLTSFLAYFIFLTSISHFAHSNTVPSYPTPTQSQICKLDLSNELFGGVNDACGNNLDRSRCCPVLAAWLFAAHARRALEISPSPPENSGGDLPMMPDDSQKCVNSLQDSLRDRNIIIPTPNASCDAVLCFCGIRLHQISSLNCPTAFNVSVSPTNRNVTGSHKATPTAAVRDLEKNCRNSSYAGCSKCLTALQKLKVHKKDGDKESDRERKMYNRDCELMALTWLLGKNKTAYIPTVSAVLRAIMYSAHPHDIKCSPDQENMPLAVDSIKFIHKSSSHAPSSPIIKLFLAIIMIGSQIILLSV